MTEQDKQDMRVIVREENERSRSCCSIGLTPEAAKTLADVAKTVDVVRKSKVIAVIITTLAGAVMFLLWEGFKAMFK